MKNHFVTYDLSLALKDLGFDEPCIMYIDDEGDLINDDTAEWIGAVKCPLRSQVFEWFRCKHNLYSEIRTFVWDYDKKELGFSVRTYLNPISIETERLIHPEVYETYYEAESACIDKLIEIVKNGR